MKLMKVIFVGSISVLESVLPSSGSVHVNSLILSISSSEKKALRCRKLFFLRTLIEGEKKNFLACFSESFFFVFH